jgi:hypothetical protein
VSNSILAALGPVAIQDSTDAVKALISHITMSDSLSADVQTILSAACEKWDDRYLQSSVMRVMASAASGQEDGRAEAREVMREVGDRDTVRDVFCRDFWMRRPTSTCRVGVTLLEEWASHSNDSGAEKWAACPLREERVARSPLPTANMPTYQASPQLQTSNCSSERGEQATDVREMANKKPKTSERSSGSRDSGGRSRSGDTVEWMQAWDAGLGCVREAVRWVATIDVAACDLSGRERLVELLEKYGKAAARANTAEPCMPRSDGVTAL